MRFGTLRLKTSLLQPVNLPAGIWWGKQVQAADTAIACSPWKWGNGWGGAPGAPSCCEPQITAPTAGPASRARAFQSQFCYFCHGAVISRLPVPAALPPQAVLCSELAANVPHPTQGESCGPSASLVMPALAKPEEQLEPGSARGGHGPGQGCMGGRGALALLQQQCCLAPAPEQEGWFLQGTELPLGSCSLHCPSSRVCWRCNTRVKQPGSAAGRLCSQSQCGHGQDFLSHLSASPPVSPNTSALHQSTGGFTIPLCRILQELRELPQASACLVAHTSQPWPGTAPAQPQHQHQSGRSRSPSAWLPHQGHCKNCPVVKTTNLEFSFQSLINNKINCRV
ncbi:uncharacterized protein LOC116791780 [Chiroxiphia lanceolata]|uniref:uncharacterized protein LOC116791780 n=1 Tax=Chiroxiphia lanceolata TaxID=296741 RepID=UPI0013CE562A|nr:uncharacterized protein LOC116791780 [Chiroxiphia lanceolata]